MPDQAADARIDIGGLKKLLAAYKKLQQLDQRTLESRFKSVLEDPNVAKALGWLTKEGTEQLEPEEALHRLENRSLRADLTLSNVTPLGAIYSIPELMFSPLLSKVKTGVGLEGTLSKFIPVSLHSESAREAQYSVANDRLAGTDAVFGYLQLKKNKRGELHRHPGDELVFVLKGEITLEIRSVGYRPRLKKGDLIHFHAELEHVARARHPSQLFIIRLNQFAEGGVRAYARDNLSKFMHAMRAPVGPNPADQLKDLKSKYELVEPWLRQISELPEFVDVPKRITDLVGLGALLRQIKDFQPIELGRRVSELNWPRNIGELYMLRRGTGPSDASVADILALSRGISGGRGDYPPNLFSSFIFPRVPNVVIIRNGTEDLFELSAVPGFESEDPSVRYFTPRFNLMGSDVAIAFIHIPPDKRTAYNRHPGFELALPIAGQIRVDIDGAGKFEAAASLGQYVHYRSDLPHCVSNPGEEPARVLVVRFFETAGHLDEGGRGEGKQKRSRRCATFGQLQGKSPDQTSGLEPDNAPTS